MSGVVNISPLVKCVRDSNVRTVDCHAVTNRGILPREKIKLEMVAGIVGRLQCFIFPWFQFVVAL